MNHVAMLPQIARCVNYISNNHAAAQSGNNDSDNCLPISEGKTRMNLTKRSEKLISQKLYITMTTPAVIVNTADNCHTLCVNNSLISPTNMADLPVNSLPAPPLLFLHSFWNRRCLQCFDATGWAAKWASGL